MSWVRNLAISNAFASVLKKHRKAKGMSQELLAEKADIHPIYVGMIERALRVLDPKLFWINPDCGLKTRGAEETIASLRNMVEATQIARNKHALV